MNEPTGREQPADQPEVEDIDLGCPKCSSIRLSVIEQQIVEYPSMIVRDANGKVRWQDLGVQNMEPRDGRDTGVRCNGRGPKGAPCGWYYIGPDWQEKLVPVEVDWKNDPHPR